MTSSAVSRPLHICQDGAVRLMWSWGPLGKDPTTFPSRNLFQGYSLFCFLKPELFSKEENPKSKGLYLPRALGYAGVRRRKEGQWLSSPLPCDFLVPYCVTLWPFLGTGAIGLLWAHHGPTFLGSFTRRQRSSNGGGVLVSIFAKVWKSFNQSDMGVQIFYEKKKIPIGWFSSKWEMKAKWNKIRDSYCWLGKMIFSTSKLM